MLQVSVQTKDAHAYADNSYSGKSCISICMQFANSTLSHTYHHMHLLKDTSEQALLVSHPFAQNSVTVAASNYSALLFFSPGTS